MLRVLKVNPLTAAVARAVGRGRTRSVRSFVFVAGTGRCGTKTLFKMFETVKGAKALHEPYPQMAREILEQCNAGRTGALNRTFWQVKVPNIYRAAKGATWYVESSHLFIVTHAYLAAEYFGDRLQVVHLRRDPLQVAASFVGRGQDPLRDPWLIRPAARLNCLDLSDLITGGGRFDHQFYRLVWYCYEIDARAAQFARRCPHVKVHRIATEELNDPDCVQALFDGLGLPLGTLDSAAVGIRANRSAKAPERPADLDPADIDAFVEICRDALEQFLASSPEDATSDAASSRR